MTGILVLITSSTPAAALSIRDIFGPARGTVAVEPGLALLAYRECFTPSRGLDKMSGSCYEAAEARFTRWLAEYRQDREAHTKARNAHPDPAALDAELFQAYCALTDVHMRAGADHEALRSAAKVATDLLLQGACADPRHFKTVARYGKNLGYIVYFLERRKMDPSLVDLLKALTALNNRRERDEQLPHFILRAIVTGHPWAAPFGLEPRSTSSSWRENHRTHRVYAFKRLQEWHFGVPSARAHSALLTRSWSFSIWKGKRCAP